MQSWFAQTAKTLDSMAKAQPSIHSLFDTKDFIFLPVSILNWNEIDQKKQLDDDAAKGMTLKDCTTSYCKHHIHSLKFKDSTMTFSDDGCDYVVSELARGDFDHDGYEDALIMTATYYQSGSGRDYRFYIVSKTDRKKRALQLADFSD
jgi:regulatory protein YycI of two-component signal transduction system YycFG